MNLITSHTHQDFQALWTTSDKTFSIEKKQFIVGLTLQENSKNIGRIALYHVPEHQIHDGPTLSFGYLECPGDSTVFQMLIHEVIKTAKDLKMKYLLGPINGNTWNDYRVVVPPQNRPFLSELVTPPHWYEWFKGMKFDIAAKYYSHISPVVETRAELLQKVIERFNKSGVSFFTLKEIIQDNKGAFAQKSLMELADVVNDSFSENYLYSPINHEHFVVDMMNKLEILDISYSYVAKKDDKIVAFIFTFPDFYDKEHKTLIVKTLARRKDPSLKGIGSALVFFSFSQALKDGYERTLHAMMHQNNTSKNISKNFKGEFLREYHLYQLSIDNYEENA